MNTASRCTGSRLTLKGYAACTMALSIGLLSGCGRATKVNASDSAVTVAVAKTARRNLSTTLDIASEFQPYQEINVYAKVSGYIQKLDVNWGTHVKRGPASRRPRNSRAPAAASTGRGRGRAQ